MKAQQIIEADEDEFFAADFLPDRSRETELKSSVRPRQEGTQPFRIVLHHTMNGKDWVVHYENVVETDRAPNFHGIGPLPGGYVSKPHPDYYWGAYFGADEYKRAVKRYVEKCRSNNLHIPLVYLNTK